MHPCVYTPTVRLTSSKMPKTVPSVIPDAVRRHLLLGFASSLLAGAPPMALAQAESDPAAERIRAFYSALLEVMKQARALGLRGRYDRLAPVIQRTFDLAAMTRIAIGPAWNSIEPAEQSALIDSFSRMTIATYANRFDGYAGERFEVEPLAETRSTGKLVRSKLLQTSGEPIALNYLMRGAGTEWKVVDVYLSGTISELATRRSEFGAVLKSGGPKQLVESLRQQTEKLLRGA